MANSVFRDQVIAHLKNNGFELVCKKKHQKYFNPETKKTVMVGHNMRDRNMGNRTLKDAGLSARLG